MNAVSLSTRGYIAPSPFQQQQEDADKVPLHPPEAQNLLSRALELPLPPEMTTEALGIHQSDVIIRSAIIAAIADLRANPWLLNYAFASLPRDPLTMKAYGEQEVDRAREWFQKTNIQVFINVNPNEVKFPCISIALQSSAEQEQEGTLGDTHYVPQENYDGRWPILAGPTTPTAYSASTGIMAFNPDDLAKLVLAPGMIILDKTGKAYPILDVLESNTVVIAPGTVADFGGLTIKPKRPAFVTQLESTVYHETYSLGCHADSEPNHLTYLHSILIFCMLRYKQALLEARGFERSTLASTDFRRENDLEMENVYSRYVSISGAVRQYWPKSTDPQITSTITEPTPLDQNCNPAPTMDADPADDSIDEDMLAIIVKQHKE